MKRQITSEVIYCLVNYIRNTVALFVFRYLLFKALKGLDISKIVFKNKFAIKCEEAVLLTSMYLYLIKK